MLIYRWASVGEAGTMLSQRRVNVLSLLGNLET